MQLSASDYSALAVAIVTATLALAGWIGNQVWSAASNSLRRQREKKATYILFYTAITIRLQNTKANFREADKIAYLKLVEESEADFKAYIAQGPDNDDFAMMEAYFPEMSAKLRFLVKALVSYDGLFDAMYRKIGSEEFATLSKERKAAVVEQLFAQAQDVITIAEKVRSEMRSIPDIKRIAGRIDLLISDLEAKPDAPVAAASASTAGQHSQ